ncbi:MAG: UDP-N-acetylmuramoyl-tripeptide--D-alanyl-D-alanine ligase [Patescibacteria group bacterium]
MLLQRLLEQYLGRCVNAAFRHEHPLVIAVAGSVGKSSTKEAIGVAIGAREKGSRVVASTKNYNNELGVPLTVFGCDAPGRNVLAWCVLLIKATCAHLGVTKNRASTFVLEMATDRPSDLARLVAIAKPNVGVLTAIGPEHTEFFGTVEGVAREEGTIVRCLGPEDAAVVNADDATVMACTSGSSANISTFGASEEATVRILETRMVIDHASQESSGLDVTIGISGSTRSFRITGTIGRPQAYAVAAALAVVNAIDGNEALAVSRLAEQYHGMPGRMRLLSGIKHTWLIDDSYNSSPLAALSAIQDLAAFPVNEGCRRIAALGDMLELGSLAEESHRDVGRAVAEAGMPTPRSRHDTIGMLVACGMLAHVVADAARSAGMSDDRIFTFSQSADAGRFIQDTLKEGDVVLIKGSQGVRMERITFELLAHPERAEELLVRQSKEWRER